MAWTPNPDGTKHCTTCGVDFRPPRSCSCPQAVTAPGGAPSLGVMEELTARARAEGLLDRLGAERALANRIRKADREARLYLDAMRRAMQRDDETNAQKWAALAESARGRADKIARVLWAIISDRERRADLERRERLAQPLAKPARAVA